MDFRMRGVVCVATLAQEAYALSAFPFVLVLITNGSESSAQSCSLTELLWKSGRVIDTWAFLAGCPH